MKTAGKAQPCRNQDVQKGSLHAASRWFVKREDANGTVSTGTVLQIFLNNDKFSDLKM
jgi:hypothetical protein